MKTTPCYPKVILHRLGGPPVVRRRLPPAGSLLLLLVLAVLTAGFLRAMTPPWDPAMRHFSSLR